MAFSGGSGSSGDPFLISNTTDLQNLYTVGDGVGKYFLQTNDINLGTITRPFNCGTTTAYRIQYVYDGAGYKIQNGSLTMDYTILYAYPSLFGYLYSSSLIKNLKFKNITLTRNGGAGGSGIGVGMIVGNFVDGTISNCVVESDCIVTSTATDFSWVGGIAGQVGNNSVNILSCENHGKVSTSHTSDSTGGIVGKGYRIFNCYNSGLIEGRTYVGGLCGSANASTYIVAKYSYNSGIIKGENYVGGCIGVLSSGKIEQCFSLGSEIVKTVNNPSAINFGRVCGYSVGTITDCYALSTMSLSNGWV